MFSKSTVKYIQSLQHKKFREQHGSFVAEGPKVVRELLAAGSFTCKQIFAINDWLGQSGELLKGIEDRVTEVDASQLERLAAYTTANKVVAEFEIKPPVQQIKFNHQVTLALDDIRDPGNLGTIIRTCDWFGVKQIICSNDTVDIYNPKVVQSTMASLGRVSVLYVDIKEKVKGCGVNMYAATMQGKPLKEMGITDEAIICMGNESRGVSDELLKISNEQISIKGRGKAESLNVAIAAGIILHEILG